VSRRAELAANLVEVRARIDAACAAAGRHAGDVTLVAVTKTHPAADVEALAGLGLHHMAENRDREAAEKAAEVGADVVWHFVGQVQTNKARSVASYADVVESVDRARLVDALSIAATRLGRSLDVLVQVALDESDGRGGVPPAGVLELAECAAAAPGLRLAGLMAVAPRGADPQLAFARLAEIGQLLRGQHPEATMVSAGMSGDLEAAVANGSTHVRVGTALLGVRSAPVV
jgi:pyridoxal phosphate enzyme (YggS family)